MNHETILNREAGWRSPEIDTIHISSWREHFALALDNLIYGFLFYQVWMGVFHLSTVGVGFRFANRLAGNLINMAIEPVLLAVFRTAMGKLCLSTKKM